MSKPIIVARFFATEVHRNINSFARIGVSFNSIEPNPINGTQPTFSNIYGGEGLKSLSITNIVRRDEFQTFSKTSSFVKSLVDLDECITIDLPSYPSLRSVTVAQKFAASLNRKLNKIQETDGSAKCFTEYLLYTFQALKVTHIYAEVFSEHQNKSKWTLYKKSDVEHLVNAYVNELAGLMKWEQSFVSQTSENKILANQYS
jgi:hypothetical protein